MSQDPNDVPSVNGEDDATEESEMGVEVEVVKMDLDKAVAITTALGFVDRCQIFSTDAEARLFITSHLFLQRRGKHPLSLFVRFTCADPRCAFTARFFRNEETTEAMVRLSDDRPWHDEGCSRVKKGAHGLSALIRANSEKLTAEKVPLRSVVANQLRLQGTAPSTKQLANARYYKNVCLNKEFDRDPLKFLEDKYPGSRVFRKVFVDAEGLPVDVVHLCRDLLLRELATEGHILLDATYKTAPNGGFTITLGFSRYNSFVPVYCAVFARQGTRDKVGETSEVYEHVLEGLLLSLNVLGLHGWQPATVIRDHSGAIRIALQKCLPTTFQIVCWFHVQQAVKNWCKEHQFTKEQSDFFLDAMRTLHLCTQEGAFRRGLDLLHFVPLGPAFIEFNNRAGRMPGGLNANWSYWQIADELGGPLSNNGIERYHRVLKATMPLHGCLRIVCEHLCRHLDETELLLLATDENRELPKYFEVREMHTNDEWRKERRLSLEFLHALQRSGVVAPFYRFERSDTASHSAVRLVSEFDMGVRCTAADTWEKYQVFTKIRTTTRDRCNCETFLRQWKGFCRHSMAVEAFLSMAHTPMSIEVRQRTPPRENATQVEAEAVSALSERNVNVRVLRTGKRIATNNGCSQAQNAQEVREVRRKL